MPTAAPPRRRPPVAFLGKVLVSALLLSLLFWRVDRGAFLRSVKTLSPAVFLACAAMFVLGYLISTLRWQRLLLAEGLHIPLWRLTLVYFEAAFFNLFLPTLIGGDIVRGYTIYRMTQGQDASIASIVVDRLTGFAALVAIALVALAAAYRDIRDPQVAAMILAVAAAFAGGLGILLNAWTMGWALRVLSLLGLRRFHARLEALVGAIRRYRRHRPALGQALLLSVLLQALIIVTFYLVSVGLHLHISIAYFFLFVPLITVVSMLPVSVAGLGVREGGVVYFFAKVGVAPAVALSMSLIWFSLTLLISSLGGLAFLLDSHAAKRLTT
jgi:uncharacterized protein (TIRG00374 family)